MLTKNEKAEQLAKSFCKRFNRSKCIRVIIAAGLIILLVGGSVFAVIRSRHTGTENTLPTTAVVTYGDIGTYIEGSGETAARNTEELGLGIEGKISQVLVSEGDEVHAGDPLVVVDPTGIREQLTAAQAEFTAAQSELTNAQAAITQAQSRIASAQSQYTHGSATAPFSGKFIASSTFAVGQKVSAGQTIGRMVNDSQMQLAVQFSSEYAKDIKAGQTATISTSVGQVSAVVSSIDSASGKGTFLVVLTVQNPSGALAQGTSATATINSDSAGTIFSSGSGTLDYIKEQVITAPIGGEITAYNGSNHTYSSGAVSGNVDLQCCSAGYFDARSSLTAAQSTAAAAQAKVSEIQTRILKLQQEILDATMTASIDGVVTSLNAEEGEETDGTEPLVVVSDLSDTVVTAELTTDEVQSVEPGQTVTMNMYTMDGSELPLTGVVDSVSPEPSQNTGSQGSLTTFKAIITVDSIEGQAISSGMMVDYKIAVAESDSCLIVPTSAIVHTADGSTGVFTKTLIDKDGKRNSIR
ncbi:MAG: HlyD family efflux transporter periplasmic adaptor subunit [Butyricicoccaceae bacterium]